MLELRSISKTFNAGTINEKKALVNVSLKLNDGDFCTVIGGNGAGKSTVMNAVAGVWPVDSGQILIGGEDVSALPEFRRAAYFGRVFQDPMTGTAGDMQIDENMALAARRGQRRTLRWGVGKKEEGEEAGSWTGGSHELQGRTSFRRTETGTDSSDGDHEEAEGSASGRAYGGA